MTEVVEAEIVHVPNDHVQLGTIMVAPEQVVVRASKIADALKDVIMSRKLYSNIQGKDYVRVEGWNTLGAMLGVLPKEEWTKELPDANGYEAKVLLVRASDGIAIGGASAMCTRDESNWSSRDDYALRSMAITRATGKAFRMGFSWIMELAGYEVTPAEEIPAPKKKSTNGRKKKSKADATTAFWEKANKIELTKEQAQEFVDAAGGDFAKAYDNLAEQYP